MFKLWKLRQLLMLTLASLAFKVLLSKYTKNCLPVPWPVATFYTYTQVPSYLHLHSITSYTYFSHAAQPSSFVCKPVHLLTSVFTPQGSLLPSALFHPAATITLVPSTPDPGPTPYLAPLCQSPLQLKSAGGSFGGGAELRKCLMKRNKDRNIG